MGINVSLAQAQSNQISHYVSELRDIQKNIDSFRGSLNNVWQADEMLSINNAISYLMNQIINCSNSLDALGSDISSTALEIRHEEEIREEQERAQATRLLQQMQQNKSNEKSLFN